MCGYIGTYHSLYHSSAIGIVIFEERIGCFNDPPTEKATEFLEHLVGFFVNMQPLMYNPPVYKFWPTPTWKTFESHAQKVNDVGLYFINKVSITF